MAVTEAELAAVATDDAQHKGLGTELYYRLIQIARDEKLTKVVSNMLPENREMRAICTRLGFKMFVQPGGQHDPRGAGFVAREPRLSSVVQRWAAGFTGCPLLLANGHVMIRYSQKCNRRRMPL